MMVNWGHYTELLVTPSNHQNKWHRQTAGNRLLHAHPTYRSSYFSGGDQSEQQKIIDTRGIRTHHLVFVKREPIQGVSFLK